MSNARRKNPSASARATLEQRDEAQVAEHHGFGGTVVDLPAHGQTLLEQRRGALVPAAPQQAVAEVVERCREPYAVAEPARDRGVLLVAGDSPIDVAQVAQRDPKLVEHERGPALVAECTEQLEARLRGLAHALVVTEAVRHQRGAGQRLRP
jgi:hypothetical protein